MKSFSLASARLLKIGAIPNGAAPSIIFNIHGGSIATRVKDPKIVKEFLYYHELRMSVSQISRRLRSDRRTAKKYIDNTSLIGQARKKSVRRSKLDSYKQRISDLLDLDITFMAKTIYRIICKDG